MAQASGGGVGAVGCFYGGMLAQTLQAAGVPTHISALAYPLCWMTWWLNAVP